MQGAISLLSRIDGFTVRRLSGYGRHSLIACGGANKLLYSLYSAGPVRPNKSSEQLKPSPGKPSPTPSKQPEPTPLPTSPPPQWLRKRQRLRKVADTKAEKKSMKETTWHKTKKRYIAKVNQFAGENVVMDKKRKATNTTESAISKSKKKSRKQQTVPPQARQEMPPVTPPAEAQETHARGHIPPIPD